MVAVACFAVDGEGLLVIVGGQVALALFIHHIGQVVERPRFTGLILEDAVLFQGLHPGLICYRIIALRVGYLAQVKQAFCF